MFPGSSRGGGCGCCDSDEADGTLRATGVAAQPARFPLSLPAPAVLRNVPIITRARTLCPADKHGGFCGPNKHADFSRNASTLAMDGRLSFGVIETSPNSVHIFRESHKVEVLAVIQMGCAFLGPLSMLTY